jgi:hypothetical protein
MPSKIYLSSYDKHDELLEYDPRAGTRKILSRREFEALGANKTMGAFTREADRVAGVYASPDGPTFFLDAERVARPFGGVTAVVEEIGPKRKRFRLTVEGRPLFDLEYRERFGIGTNPYDTEAEDIDLFALIARGTKNAKFFEGYTKDWV